MNCRFDGLCRAASTAHRDLAEFDFRYYRRTALKISDMAHTNDALKGIGDRRVASGFVKPVSPKQRLKKLKRVGKAWKKG